ncbi:hypothetical protein QYE76_017455 [Lolium multiflorum]|uniref:Reverse transcriptase domain-containing protein n=1 Tax=Lolium multiflorum TaxID=4521 RepID=A0AAD8QIM7_LOLMU|nr:hypothetical protein QYE76_017455 [Lolium multiflorum]
MIVNLPPGGVGTRNVSRSPAESGTTEAATTKAKAATEAGVNTVKGEENQKAEAKGHIGPLAGATYQRTMQRCLKDQIGRNVHTYVDDIAVMTRKGSDLISDLTETFENLRRYKMMLNPLKCVFGVPAGKLLGFIVSNSGIEVNPEKIKAILCIKRPTCLKDVQRLTGCVAAISRNSDAIIVVESGIAHSWPETWSSAFAR